MKVCSILGKKIFISKVFEIVSKVFERHFEMLPQSTGGIPWSSRKHLVDKTEFIASMDVYPYATEHLHTSNL